MTALSPATAAPPAAEARPVADLRALKKIYYKPDGSIMVEALRGIDLVISRGEYTAIMGASGSGKSTLMNVLGCLDRPTMGNYFLDNLDVSAMTDEEVSHYRGEKIGFIFQAFNLIPELTVEENVEVPLFYQGKHRSLRRERAREALELVGLSNRADHRPRELSGGQQQRVAIARALVTRPVVLMADEPTGNLDSATGRAILRVFQKLHEEGMTIIMVTHDPVVAKRCQRVVRLADGLIESDLRQEPLIDTGPDFAA
ncbi:MAG: ABC transporter ATP-binding protein [Phycisphaerales bacterium]|nr:ABC transporter ATP-binding protein [Phycisphaerales bacterium]